MGPSNLTRFPYGPAEFTLGPQSKESTSPAQALESGSSPLGSGATGSFQFLLPLHFQHPALFHTQALESEPSELFLVRRHFNQLSPHRAFRKRLQESEPQIIIIIKRIVKCLALSPSQLLSRKHCSVPNFILLLMGCKGLLHKKLLSGRRLSGLIECFAVCQKAGEISQDKQFVFFC